MRLKKIAALALTGVIMAGVALTGCGSMDPEATQANTTEQTDTNAVVEE